MSKNNMQKKIFLLVLPLNPVKRLTGGMVAFLSHIEALDALRYSSSFCVMTDEGTESDIADREELCKKFPYVKFIFLQRMHVSDPGSFWGKLIKYFRYLISGLPYDVFMRTPMPSGFDFDGVNTPAIVVFDHLYSYNRFQHALDLSNGYFCISHNIESDIAHQRVLAEAGLFKKLFRKFDSIRMKSLEWRVFNSSLENIFISKEDLLKSDAPRARLSTEVLPISRKRWKYVGSRNIVFLGGMDYFPNLDAVRWLRFSLFPLLKELIPEVEFTIIGKTVGVDILQYTTEDFTFAGFVDVDQLDQLLSSCAFLISPVDLGSGIKIKLLEALSRGVPIVATSNSVSGLYSISSFVLIDRNKPNDAALACKKLLDGGALAELSECLSVEYEKFLVENASLQSIFSEYLEKIS